MTTDARPIIPVLSWEESAEQFDGEMYPNTGRYMEPHRHKHEQCGHVDGCPWPWQREPCQAYEHWDKECSDCWVTRTGAE